MEEKRSSAPDGQCPPLRPGHTLEVAGSSSSSSSGGQQAHCGCTAISGGLEAMTTAPQSLQVGTGAGLLIREGSERSMRLLQPPLVPIVGSGLPAPRVYEVWNQMGSQSRMVCCGRCHTGPHIDFWYSCCAWSFILVPSVLYFVVCAKWLWFHVSMWLPIITGLIFLSTILLLLLTACSDPGIIPRHEHQRAIPGLAEEVAAAIGAGPPIIDETTQEPLVELTAQQVADGYRWCPSCKVIRPPRASHCRDCNNCVLTWDHHCPFVNNCVGQRNYTYFSGFLCSTVCLGFSVFGGMGLFFYYGSRAGSGSILEGPALYVLLIAVGLPTVVLAVGVTGLTLFHACLACSGRTTKEVCNAIFKGQAAVGGQTLSGVRTPSLLHSRDRVEYPLPTV